jgi:hypothetical protein
MNVCGDAGVDAFTPGAGGCIDMGNFDANDTFDYSGALAHALEAGVKVHTSAPNHLQCFANVCRK